MFDRSAFKGGDDWLSTDLGSFVNKGNSGKIITPRENTIAESIRLPTRVQDRPKLKKGTVPCLDDLLETCQVHRLLQEHNSCSKTRWVFT